MAETSGSGTQSDPYTFVNCPVSEARDILHDHYVSQNSTVRVSRNDLGGYTYNVVSVSPTNGGLTVSGYSLEGTANLIANYKVSCAKFRQFPYQFEQFSFSFHVVAPTYTHTIAYNANSGSGSMGNTTVTDTNSGNTNVTFASNGFTAPTGHYFAGWRINNTGTVYQPGNTYAVGGNGSVTAYAYWLPNSYTVSLTAGTGGTVSGGGSYTYGSTANISATPNSGYKFVQWSDGNTNASRSFTVTGNVTLTATFAIAVARTNVNVNGSWVKGSVYVNVGGIWKESKKIYVKVNGVWEESSG